MLKIFKENAILSILFNKKSMPKKFTLNDQRSQNYSYLKNKRLSSNKKIHCNNSQNGNREDTNMLAVCQQSNNHNNFRIR